MWNPDGCHNIYTLHSEPVKLYFTNPQSRLLQQTAHFFFLSTIYVNIAKPKPRILHTLPKVIRNIHISPFQKYFLRSFNIPPPFRSRRISSGQPYILPFPCLAIFYNIRHKKSSAKRLTKQGSFTLQFNGFCKMSCYFFAPMI